MSIDYTIIRSRRKTILKLIPARVKEYAEIIGVSYGRITIRNQKTRWGSCIPSKNQITLNENLIHFSQACIESVVISNMTLITVID